MTEDELNLTEGQRDSIEIALAFVVALMLGWWLHRRGLHEAPRILCRVAPWLRSSSRTCFCAGVFNTDLLREHHERCR